MIQMVVLILVAGNETTTTLIGNAALELAARPDLADRLRREPALRDCCDRGSAALLLAGAVRPAARDLRVELHGVKLEENDYVLCWIASANRDEAVFEDAERFDATRGAIPTSRFGFGAHYCVGANLARLEARVALAALLGATRSLGARRRRRAAAAPEPGLSRCHAPRAAPRSALLPLGLEEGVGGGGERLAREDARHQVALAEQRLAAQAGRAGPRPGVRSSARRLPSKPSYT